MSTSKTVVKNDDALALEMRKVKALEKIANTLDALTIWVEDIDKQEWSDRIQYYLSEFHTMASPNNKLPSTKIVKMEDEDDDTDEIYNND
jgi:hypothetical protein